MIREEALNEGVIIGMQKGKEQGKAEGKAEGKTEGKAEGKVEALQEAVIDALKTKFKVVPIRLIKNIQNKPLRVEMPPPISGPTWL